MMRLLFEIDREHSDSHRWLVDERARPLPGVKAYVCAVCGMFGECTGDGLSPTIAEYDLSCEHTQQLPLLGRERKPSRRPAPAP
jgi:hypothetical protein